MFALLLKQHLVIYVYYAAFLLKPRGFAKGFFQRVKKTRKTRTNHVKFPDFSLRIRLYVLRVRDFPYNPILGMGFRPSILF